MTIRRTLLCCLLTPIGLLCSAVSAPAGTFSVTNTDDTGSGSLRQAITDANALGDPANTISFSGAGGSGTITLASPLPLINAKLSIDGPGVTTLTISGNNAHRVFYVESGTVTIQYLTLSGGQATGGDGGDSSAGNGGAGGGGLGAGAAVFVRSGAAVTLDDVAITNNSASGGQGGTRSGSNTFGGGGGGGGLGGNGGSASDMGGAGGGGLYGNGGNASAGAGAGGAGFNGNGGNATSSGGAGGGGLNGDGGNASNSGGAGGGGLNGDGGNSAESGGGGGGGGANDDGGDNNSSFGADGGGPNAGAGGNVPGNGGDDSGGGGSDDSGLMGGNGGTNGGGGGSGLRGNPLTGGSSLPGGAGGENGGGGGSGNGGDSAGFGGNGGRNGGGGGTGRADNGNSQGGDGGINGGGGGLGEGTNVGNRAGNGGFAGGGGGASGGSFLGNLGGNGGFGAGAGGGGGSNTATAGDGGNGGYGAGAGGAGISQLRADGLPGTSGTFGGAGGESTAGHGGGGAALGGAVFVEQGGMLVIRGNTTASSNAVTAGSGGGTGAGDGQALGTGFFLHNVDLMFDITGMTTISDNLTDNSLLNGGDGTVSQLFKSGPGTLVLGAANQYHGGTSINGGTIRLEDNLGLGTGTLTVLGSTLDLANGITSANNIDLQNDLTISQADSGGLGTLTGIISETGGPFGLTKTGVGTIVLQGQNTFTGLVSVQAGRLTLNSGDERFASGVGIDVTAGAVFEIDSITETVSSLTGLGSIEITNAGTFRVNNSSASVFGGVISGTGTLTKLGAGTVNLTGTSLLPGNTSVDAGTLRVNGSLPGAVAVNSGGTLGGAGMVGNTTINSGGRIAPGNSIGTMTVNGNFTQEAGSEFEVELNPASNPTTPGTDNDFIDVNGGSATLNGGNVNVIASGNPDLGTLYTILDADGGVTGTYASLTDNVVSRDFNLIYNPGNVQLSVSRTALNLGALGQTFNERAVGSALDVIFPTAGGEAGAALDQFFLLTPNQQQATLNELGGDIFGSLGVASLQTTSFILGQLGDSLNATPFSSPPPLVITTPGGFGAGDASIRLVSASTGCASVLDNANATDIDTLMIHAPQRRAQSPSACDWNGFVTGYGMGGFLQSDGNAAGLDYGLGGVMVGVFREVERGQRMGLFGAFGRSDASTGSPRQSAETDHYLGGLFLQSVDGCDKWTQDGVCGPIRPTLSALWMHEYADESTSVTSSFGGTPSFTTRGLDLGSDWAVLGAGLSWQATRRLTLSLNYTTQANDQTSLHYGGGTAVWAW